MPKTHSNRPTVFLLLLFSILSLPGATLAQSDTLVDFFGHVPHTWDDGDPETDNRIHLRGRLIEPAGAGPHPAVVVLHGSAGMWTTPPDDNLPLGDMKSQFDDWAAMLSADGYVTLILDSFGPRGYSTFQGKVPPEDADVAPVYERARDAYDALAYLRGLPNVDGDRVGLLGFSHGGGGVAGALADADTIEATMGTSFTVSTSQGPQPGVYAVPRPARPEANQAGFDCGVAYYPGALFFSYFGGTDPNDGAYLPTSSLRMIYGDTDPLWTNGHPDVLEQKALLAGSNDLVLSLYANVGHSFDTSGTPEALDARTETRNVFADCLAGAEVTGRLWADLDADGFESNSEPPLEGVLIEITDGVDVWQTTSDPNGEYRFQGLPADTYALSVAIPADYAAITVGSSVLDAQGDTLPFALVQGQTLAAQHAPLWPSGTAGQIAGVVWDDDADGLFEGGESGLAALDVHLETPGGTVLATTVTAQDGSYAFDNLLPGSYRLRIVADGWRATTPGADSVLIGDLFSDPLAVAADAVVSADAGLVTVCETFPLVAYGSSWAYELDVDPPAGWQTDAYDDSGWPRGHGLLGHAGYTQVNTSLATSNRVTRYFRHTFDLAEPDLIAQLRLELERDDGAIVTLNGVEILRSNLPDVVDATTTALSHSWLVEKDVVVDPSLLVTGTNVLAVELHQKSTGGTPDWAFDLEMRATACEPCRVAAVEIDVAADTHLRSSASASVHGGWSTLWMVGGNAPRAGLLRLALPALPPGSQVLGADLIFEVTSNSIAYFPIYALASDWQEHQASWQVASDLDTWLLGDFAADDVTGPPLGVAHIESQETTYALGLNTAGIVQLEQWLAGAPHHGLAITPWGSTSGDNLAFSSREGATAPRLRLVYRDGSCQQ